MFHTSRNPELNKPGAIKQTEIFGDCLFFSYDVYRMSLDCKYVYEADFQNTTHVSNLYDESICSEIAEFFGVDIETAEQLLDGRESEWNYISDGEHSWWLQKKRGECAKKMGYDGCEDEDEQGTVYVIPMTGRESELRLVESAD